MTAIHWWQAFEKHDRAQAVGPNPYNPAARPTITLPNLQAILGATVRSGSAGYVVEVFGIAGNVVTFMVRYPRGTIAAAAVVAALADHAALPHAGGAVDAHAGVTVADHADHAHDLVFEANPAANAVTMAADSLRNASAGALTVTGAGADGGIQNTAIPAHVVTQPNAHVFTQSNDHPIVAHGAGAAVVSAVGLEVPLADVVDMSGITFFVEAWGN